MLGGNEEFAGESRFGGTAAEGFYGGEMGEIRIVVLLRDVGEDEIAGAGVEAVGIGQEFTNRMIGKMAGAREDTLLDDPGVRTDLEHVEIVIGLENHAIGFAEMNFDHFGEVAEVGADRDFGAVGAEGEADGIGSVVGNGKRVDVDIADGEVLTGLNRFDTFEALLESLREDAVERVNGGFGDEERRGFPDAEDLWKAGAVVGVLVGDENGVEMIDFTADSGETSQGFAFAKTGVDENAGALCFQQCDVARATGRKNGNAQADGCPPELQSYENFSNDGREGKQRQ